VEYSVRLIPFNSVPVSVDGGVNPLCNECMSIDCTNPIAKTKVSIFGKEETYRMYRQGGSYKMVIDCDGFMKSPDVDEKEDSEEEFEED